jgi:AcrR family transcriptional regulator
VSGSRPYAGRALPLPPEERRLGLVEVALDLVRRNQAMPSTRELALAAGIAEGTIFRAFGTKDALREAMISAVACPYPYRDSVDAIDSSLPLDEKFLAMTTLLWDRFAEIFASLGPLGVFGPPPHGEHPGCPGDPPEPLDTAAFRDRTRRLLAPHQSELRTDLDEVIDAMRYLCFAGSNRGITDNQLLAPERIVDLLLNGARATGMPAGPTPPDVRTGPGVPTDPGVPAASDGRPKPAVPTDSATPLEDPPC